MPLYIEVVPARVRTKAFEIKDADKLQHIHSNLWKYGEQDFIVEVGAPIVGGAVVWLDGRPTYMLQDKYKAKYEFNSYYGETQPSQAFANHATKVGSTELTPLKMGVKPADPSVVTPMHVDKFKPTA